MRIKTRPGVCWGVEVWGGKTELCLELGGGGGVMGGGAPTQPPIAQYSGPHRLDSCRNMQWLKWKIPAQSEYFCDPETCLSCGPAYT